MTVRTKLLATGRETPPADGSIDVYTCPDGETVIVKTVALRVRVPTATFVLLRRTRGGVTTYLQGVENHTNAVPVILWESWWVMLPGDVLSLQFDAAVTDIAWDVSGTELEGLAD